MATEMFKLMTHFYHQFVEINIFFLNDQKKKKNPKFWPMSGYTLHSVLDLISSTYRSDFINILNNLQRKTVLFHNKDDKITCYVQSIKVWFILNELNKNTLDFAEHIIFLFIITCILLFNYM